MDELFGEAEVDEEGKLNYEVWIHQKIWKACCDDDDGGDDSTETFEHDIDDAGDAFNKNFDKRFDNHPFLNILQWWWRWETLSKSFDNRLAGSLPSSGIKVNGWSLVWVKI